jgi:hypothetical protein
MVSALAHSYACCIAAPQPWLFIIKQLLRLLTHSLCHTSKPLMLTYTKPLKLLPSMPFLGPKILSKIAGSTLPWYSQGKKHFEAIWSNHGRDICSNIWWNTQASGPTGPMTVVFCDIVAASIQLTGSLETALGITFNLLSVVLPNYFWTDKHVRICMKFSLRSFWFEWVVLINCTSSIIPL